MSWFMEKATVRNACRAFKEINAFDGEGDYWPATRDVLKKLLEERIDEKLEQYFGWARDQRRRDEDREDYRNGFYLRHLLTELGDICLRMARSRRRFVSRMLEAYRRRSRSIDRLMMVCFVLGMST